MDFTGDAYCDRVDLRVAARLVGNLLNVSESTTCSTFAAELYHFVSYEKKELPGQVLSGIN